MQWMYAMGAQAMRVSKDISYLGNLKQNQYFILFTYFTRAYGKAFYLLIEFHSLSNVRYGSLASLSLARSPHLQYAALPKATRFHEGIISIPSFRPRTIRSHVH